MYCPECGTLNKDGSQFCLNCGHSLEGESGAPAAQPEPAAQFTPAPSAAPQYNAAPQYSAPAQNAAPQYYPGQNFAPYPAAGDTPAVKALRARASSPLFMIAAILVTLSVIAALVVALVPGKTDFILDIIGEVKSKTGADIDLGKVEDALDTAETASAASMITSQIPSYIIIAGLWITFCTAKKNSGRFNTSGLTMLKVICIIMLVLISIVLAFVLLCVVMFAISSGIALNRISSSDIVSTMNVASVIVYSILGAVALSCVLCILFFANSVKTINSVKKTANTGAPNDRISAFVGVLLFILGGSSVISFVSSLAYIGTFLGGYISLPMIASICNGVAYILLGVSLFGYRSDMKALTANSYPQMMR